MFGSNRVNNDARIGSHSSGNIIMQGSQVSNPTFILGSNREMLDMAAQLGRYDVVQQQFAAYVMYCDARISNFGAVKRAVRRKRKNIHIIIKPQKGKEYFLKYLRFDGLKCFVDTEG